MQNQYPSKCLSNLHYTLFLSLSAFPDIEYFKPLFEFVGRYGVGGTTSVFPLIGNTFRDFPAALTSCFCQPGSCSDCVVLFQRAQLVSWLQLEWIFLMETLTNPTCCQNLTSLTGNKLFSCLLNQISQGLTSDFVLSHPEEEHFLKKDKILN